MPGEMALTITATGIPEVRALVEAAHKVIEARAAGADTYEADAEIDELERALARLGGYYEKVCSQCGKLFEPKHRPHLDETTWMDPWEWLRSPAAQPILQQNWGPVLDG